MPGMSRTALANPPRLEKHPLLDGRYRARFGRREIGIFKALDGSGWKWTSPDEDVSQPYRSAQEALNAAVAHFRRAIVAKRPPSEMSSTGKKWQNLAVRQFGVTTDPLEAGYVLRDGRMLDFSGKREGGSPRTRAFDHREIGRASTDDVDVPGGSDGMVTFMQETLSIRVHLDRDYAAIDMEGISGQPSPAQVKTLLRAWREIGRPSNVGLDRGPGDNAHYEVFSENQLAALLTKKTRSNPPMSAIAPRTAAALRSVAADPSAPVDSRVAAVAVLTGEAKRRGLVSRFTAAAARAARGAAATVLRAVRRNPEEFPKWTPPVIPGGPELKLYRISPGKRTKPIVSSRDIAAAFGFLAFQHNEEFWVALLDSRNRIIGRVLMTRGTVGQSPVYTSEIMRVVLHSGAHRFAAAHCHPSGFTEPSPDDIAITKHLKKACDLLGDIRFVDHVIVGDVSGTPGHLYGRPAHGATPEAADQAHGVAEKMAAVEGQPIFYTSLNDLGLM